MKKIIAFSILIFIVIAIYIYGSMAKVGFINETNLTFKTVEIKGNNTTKTFKNIKPKAYKNQIEMWCLWNTKVTIKVITNRNDTLINSYNIKQRLLGDYYNKCTFYCKNANGNLCSCDTLPITFYQGEIYSF
jgi:hypothetical protein